MENAVEPAGYQQMLNLLLAVHTRYGVKILSSQLPAIRALRRFAVGRKIELSGRIIV